LARRTVSMTEHTEELVRSMAHVGESFSGTVSRLIEAGARAVRGGTSLSYIGVGEGPEDLGINAEAYLRDLASSQ
jgi:hypothetical protein